jgi:hypothetical protein
MPTDPVDAEAPAPGLRGPNAESGLRGPNAESGLRGPNAESGLRGPNAESGLHGPNATSDLPQLLRARRERLGYVGDDGIDQVAGVAALPAERWRQFEAQAAAPSPDELPRIALALVDISRSGPGDDPGELLARLQACLADGP